ncbi:Lipid phosphate phosphatase [Seminavis robusta]|uniref:Lipid phosphate phosphatase n=1 Tax=Seminavis robusta TaxID=568900 RepID=A0A9N8DZV9_9STRA|nr:Lipid phosphate phosphatase [Seminavis robusta]|eukprot:Sro486_g152630.1 Lipid phosphate phosphatase (312) ;mRNA; r:32088-33119
MQPLFLEDTGTDTNAEHPATPYRLSDVDNLHEAIRSDAARWKTRFTAYFWSPDGKELLSCVSFGLIFFIIGYVFPTTNQRPLPYQYLEGTGDYVRNLVYNEALQDETVPDWQLAVLCVILCPMLQLIFALVHGNVGDIHKTLCVYCIVITITGTGTSILKDFVGYLRPIFYNLCQPSDNYEYCTQGDDDDDLRMSFPSGHASWSFATLTLLYLYLERCLGLSGASQFTTTLATSSNQEIVVLQYPKNAFRYRCHSLLCLIPLGLATFVAVSRVHDNEHFPADILAGSLLGATIARHCHQVWFPDARLNCRK